MRNLLLGVDIGTTATKAVLIDYEGKFVSQGRAEHPTHHLTTGWVEQEPEDWWRSFCSAISEAKKSVPDSKITAVLISAQAPTMLPVDSGGNPIRPALIWMDRRSETQAKDLANRFPDISTLTGNRADPFYVASKIKWFIENEPENYLKTKYFLQIPGYLNFKLTGKFGTDKSHSSLLQLRDSSNKDWQREVLKYVGVDPEKFGNIGHSTQEFAEVAAVNDSGVEVGTPVFFGSVDGCTAGIEAGVIEPGIVAEMSGTSTVLLMPTAGNILNDKFISIEHALPNRNLLLGAMVSSGASIAWLDQNIFKGHTSIPDLIANSEKVPPGSSGLIFLPYMMGERSPIWNSNARGIFFGLTLSTTPEAMFRSALEGTAFAMRHNILEARNSGIKVDAVRSVGGGTRNNLWNQIKADVLGIPIVTLQESSGAALGCAYLAGFGLGVFEDIHQVLSSNLKVERDFEPNPHNQRLYEEQYGIFRSIYESTKLDFDKLAKITESGASK
jgi:xylulokinase